MPPRPTLDFPPNITLEESLLGQYVDKNLAPSVPGGLVYIPSTSDSNNIKSASISTANLAARLSLSLILITYNNNNSNNKQSVRFALLI